MSTDSTTLNQGHPPQFGIKFIFFHFDGSSVIT